MIVKMKKFSLLTLESVKAGLLLSLQRYQNVHFRDLTKNEAESELSRVPSQSEITFYENELGKISFLIEKLEPIAQKPKGLTALRTPRRQMTFDEFDKAAESFDYVSVYDSVKSKDEQIKNLRTEKNRLKADVDLYRAWQSLDIRTDAANELKYASCLIGTVDSASLPRLSEELSSLSKTCHWEFITSIKEDSAIGLICHKDESAAVSQLLKSFGFAKATIDTNRLPSEAVSEIAARIAEIESEEAAITASLKFHASAYFELVTVKEALKSALERALVCEKLLKTKSVLIVSGWYPAEFENEFISSVENVCQKDYFLESEDESKDSEEVPIKLKNNWVVAAFESVTSMYSMPKYNEIDPTPVFMPFYFIFFGFMVGDMGYGLLMMIATALAIKFLNLPTGTKNFLKFFFVLSFGVILGGAVYGGFFGFTVLKPIPMADGISYKPILDSQLDIVTMIVASIALGAVQIVCGLLVKGYICIKDGRPLDALMDSLTFIVTLLGALGLLVSAAVPMGSVFVQVSKWMMIGGMVAIAATQGRSSNSIGGKIASGLYAVYGLTSYIGDLVSYTRIMALALSGAFIAFSFNLMIDLIPAGPFYIIRILFGSLIFIFGQALNLGLGALGAYVHSCRLQYVEYFGKFYEGGGVPFEPLSYRNDTVDLVK